MTLPYGAFQVGGSVEPLTTSGGNSLLQDADASLFQALAYWTWIIQNHPGPRMVQAMQAAGMKDSTGAPVSNAVESAIPYDPNPDWLISQIKLPCLACWRTTTEYNQYTTSFYFDRCGWDILYILPPLTAAQSEQVLPAMRAVEASLRNRSMFGFDPNYTPPGGVQGQIPWAAPLASVMAVWFNRGSFGALENSGNLVFPALRMSGAFDERDMPLVTGVGPITGVDTSATLVAPDGTSIANVAVSSTFAAPTIASLSVGSGTQNGGTSVTITGTGFLPGIPGPPGPPAVFFGGRPATSVTYVSATSITCVTPAMSGTGTVNVILVNADGQQVTALGAFSFV